MRSVGLREAGELRFDRSVTIWHYKAELLHGDEHFGTYRFFPDHVMAPNVSGVFRLDLRSYAPQVVEPAHAEANGLVSTDEHCVSALTHKIRREIEQSGRVPETAFFVA